MFLKTRHAHNIRDKYIKTQDFQTNCGGEKLVGIVFPSQPHMIVNTASGGNAPLSSCHEEELPKADTNVPPDVIKTQPLATSTQLAQSLSTAMETIPEPHPYNTKMSVNAGMNLMTMGREPINVTCQKCKQVIHTHIKYYKPKFFYPCMGLFDILKYCERRQDIIHFCPLCQHIISIIPLSL